MFRPLLWPTLLTLAGVLTMVSLGTWQLDRRDWKHALIARASENSEKPPVDLPPREDWGSLDGARWEYRPVRLAGVFDHDREVHAFTSLSEPKGPLGGPGYWVLTPLALEGGGTVLINRGFVPDENKDPATRAAGQVSGPQNVVGLFRVSEDPGAFVPGANLEDNVWYARDVAEIARARAIDDAAPFYVDAQASAPGGLPQGGETRIAFRDDHMTYALTWYGLAVALVLVYLAYHHARGRIGRVR